MKLCDGKSRLDIWKRFFSERMASQEESSQGIACGYKSVWIQGASEQHSLSYGLVLESPVLSRVGLDDPYEFLLTWDILWFCDLKISCYRVEYPQHAKWVSKARANEKFKLVSELKQIQYHATFLITLPHPHRHITTSHHSRSLCSRCTWDAHCVLVYLLPKVLWFTCWQMPNLLGIPDLWILQIPSCQSMSPSLVPLVWHPCAFLPLVKYVYLHNTLCKQELPTMRCDQHLALQAEFSRLL